jgi:hypothetical protein
MHRGALSYKTYMLNRYVDSISQALSSQTKILRSVKQRQLHDHHELLDEPLSLPDLQD